MRNIHEQRTAASLHPAQMIGASPKKGTLNIGADADFVMLSDQVRRWVFRGHLRTLKRERGERSRREGGREITDTAPVACINTVV